MTGKAYVWHKVAGSIEEIFFASNNIAEVTVAGKTVCIANLGDKLFCCTHKCPHAGGALADGFLDATGNIVCPLHRYKFSAQTGRNTSGEGYFLKTFPIETRADGIFVGFEENNFFKWLK